MEKHNKLIGGLVRGNLVIMWSWNRKDGEKVWKCKCRLCDKIYYIKERAIVQGIVSGCDCEQRQKPKKPALTSAGAADKIST